MTKIRPTRNAITFNTYLPVKSLVSAIAITAIFGWISIPVSAQPTVEPQPQTTPPSPEAASPLPQQTSYMGFGGVIGLQGQTTSLSQGSFSMFSKYVLSNNLALHSTSTIFASSVASNSLDLTFNQPIEINDLPFIFTPFVGGGVLVYSENGTRIVPHLTGGIDASTPFGVTATLRFEAGFVQDRKADVGIVFGIGRNF